MARARRFASLFAIVACVAVVAVAASHGRALLHWIASGSAGAVLTFVAIYVAATLLLTPPGILNAAAGALFGTAFGLALVFPANVAAALLGFLLSRSAAGAWARRQFQRRRSWTAIDRAIERAGFRIVFLLRCSPVSPFSILNYFLGMTRVRFRDYALGTLIGALPGTLLYVYAGSAVSSVAELWKHGMGHGAGQQIFFWAGLGATAAAVVLITKYARRELREAAEADADVSLPAMLPAGD